MQPQIIPEMQPMYMMPQIPVEPKSNKALIIGIGIAVVVVIIVVLFLVIQFVVLPKVNEKQQSDTKPDSKNTDNKTTDDDTGLFEITDDNKYFVVEVCTSCPGPSEGAGVGGGRYEVILKKGKYNGEKMATEMQTKLNALFKQKNSSLPREDFEIKFDKDVGNFTIRNKSKRAWWLKDNGVGSRNAYELLGIDGALGEHGNPNKNWTWNGDTFAGKTVVESFWVYRY